MKVDRIMRRDVQRIQRGASLREAAELMRDHDTGFLPVVGSDFRVCGVVTDRDLVVRALANGRTGDVRIDEVMNPDIIAVRRDDLVHEAERKMRQWKKSRVLVLDEDGLCCGILTKVELARHNAANRAAKVVGPSAERQAWRHTDANFRRPRRSA